MCGLCVWWAVGGVEGAPPLRPHAESLRQTPTQEHHAENETQQEEHSPGGARAARLSFFKMLDSGGGAGGLQWMASHSLPGRDPSEDEDTRADGSSDPNEREVHRAEGPHQPSRARHRHRRRHRDVDRRSGAGGSRSTY